MQIVFFFTVSHTVQTILSTTFEESYCFVLMFLGASILHYAKLH